MIQAVHEKQQSDIEVFTRAQAARKAQVSLCTLDRAIKAGDLRVKRLSRKILIPRSAFYEWINGESQEGAAR